MDLTHILRSIRRGWKLLVLCAIVAIAISAVLTIVAKPQYMSTSSAFVSTGTASNISDLSQGSSFTQQVVKSYADVATSPYVLDGVIARLRLPYSASQLADKVTAVAPLDTVVLNIEVIDDSPSRAAAIANSIADGLSKAVVSLSPSTQSSASVKITRIQAATPPARPSTPKWLNNLLVGALIGVLIGLLLVITRGRFDTKIRGESDLNETTSLPVLGSLIFDTAIRSSPLFFQDLALSTLAENIRSLRANLQFVALDSSLRSVVVTSTVEGEGKSTVASNLALALADSGLRVVLVDADLRRPRIAELFGIDGGTGLSDVIIGTVDLDLALQSWGVGSLSVLVAGRSVPNPNEILQSERMRSVMASLEARADIIIYDTPPILPVSDGVILARRTSGAVLVAGVGRVRKNDFTRALDSLKQAQVRSLGVMLSMVPRRGPDAYGYAAYGYGQQPGPRAR